MSILVNPIKRTIKNWYLSAWLCESSWVTRESAIRAGCLNRQKCTVIRSKQSRNIFGNNNILGVWTAEGLRVSSPRFTIWKCDFRAASRLHQLGSQWGRLSPLQHLRCHWWGLLPLQHLGRPTFWLRCWHFWCLFRPFKHLRRLRCFSWIIHWPARRCFIIRDSRLFRHILSATYRLHTCRRFPSRRGFWMKRHARRSLSS